MLRFLAVLLGSLLVLSLLISSSFAFPKHSQGGDDDEAKNIFAVGYFSNDGLSVYCDNQDSWLSYDAILDENKYDMLSTDDGVFLASAGQGSQSQSTLTTKFSKVIAANESKLIVEWTTLAVGSADSSQLIFAIEDDKNGKIFFAGQFGKPLNGATNFNNVAFYDTANETIFPMGSGIPGAKVVSLAYFKEASILFAGIEATEPSDQDDTAPAVLYVWDATKQTWTPLNEYTPKKSNNNNNNNYNSQLGKPDSSHHHPDPSQSPYNPDPNPTSSPTAPSKFGIWALAVHEEYLWVGGSFSTESAGQDITRLNILNGLGNLELICENGVTSTEPNTLAAVKCICFDEDGTAYVAGAFNKINDVAANNIAIYELDEKAWKPLGSGTNGAIETCLIENGILYIGGSFTQAGGVAVQNIASYNISSGSWNTTGQGVTLDNDASDTKVRKLRAIANAPGVDGICNPPSKSNLTLILIIAGASVGGLLFCFCLVVFIILIISCARRCKERRAEEEREALLRGTAKKAKKTKKSSPPKSKSTKNDKKTKDLEESERGEVRIGRRSDRGKMTTQGSVNKSSEDFSGFYPYLYDNTRKSLRYDSDSDSEYSD